MTPGRSLDPGSESSQSPTAIRKIPDVGEPDDFVHGVSLTRFAGPRGEVAADAVVREEPLEIQLGGTSLAVVMRTPGHDYELALGFLVTEQIVPSLDVVQSIHHSSMAGAPESEENVIRVILKPGVELDLDALRRNFYASSSCGICGKASIAIALREAPPLDDGIRFDAEYLYGLPARLRNAQEVFARTGGLHAAGIFDPAGELLVVREDVGRHNAVDKVVGWCAGQQRLPLSGHALMVSGRISFEIVSKALFARLPVVAAISAPTSLAVDLAERSGVTLVGFLRDRGFNVYGRRDRIVG